MKKKNDTTKNSSLATLSRRQFLQATAATCLAASMMTACSGGDSQDDTFVPDNNDLDFKEGVWHKSYCGGCIWTNCGTEVKVQNGVAIELKGQKDHPSNKGSLCTRGSAMLMNLYNPWRVKAPMKRTKNFGQQKGMNADPGWMEITWEEAMDTIVQKMSEIQDTNDPVFPFKKMFHTYGFSQTPHEGAMFKVMRGQVLRSPNAMGSAGPLCEVHHAPTMYSTTFVDRVDVGYCDYLIKLGRNLGDNVMYGSGGSRAVADAVERTGTQPGTRPMKIISVDPHCGVGESRSGEWVPINPATDMAFLMGMMHIMLHEENVYDIDSVRWRSNSPYLVYAEGYGDLNGTYVRDGYDPSTFDQAAAEADMVDVSKKPLIMGVDSVIRTYDNYKNEATAASMPDFEYDTGLVGGRRITTGFVLLRESVADDAVGRANIMAKTGETFLDAVERLTGISKADMRRITNDFIDATTVDRSTLKGQNITLDGVTFPLRPATVAVGRGAANQIQGQRVYITANVVNLLMGAIGVPGTVVCASEPDYIYEDGMMRPHDLDYKTSRLLRIFADKDNQFSYNGQHFYPSAYFPVNGFVFQAILDPAKYDLNYDIELVFAYGTNPFTANGSQDLTTEVYKKFPYVFNICYQYDEVAMFSDLLLPQNTHYERVQVRNVDEISTVDKNSIQLRGMNYKEPVIAPVYNTRTYEEMMLEVVDKLGLYEEFIGRFNGFYGKAGAAAKPQGTPMFQIHPNLNPSQKYTYKEICDHVLKDLTGGNGTEWFNENGFFMKNTPLKECYEYYYFQEQLKDVPLDDPRFANYPNYSQTARLPIYDYVDFMAGKYLQKALSTYTNPDGDVATIPGWKPENMHIVFREFTPVPMWYDNYMVDPAIANGNLNDAGVSTFGAGDTEYDMYAVNWKITVRNLGLGGQDDNVWLQEIRNNHEFDDHRIQINPATAAAKGIKDGDNVRVTSLSSGAVVTGIAKVTGLIKENCIGFPGQGAQKSPQVNPICKKGSNYNKLLSHKEYWILPDAGAICISVRVKIEKA